MDGLKQIFIIDTNTKLQKTLLTQASRSGLSVGHVRFPSASALKKYPTADVSSGIVTVNLLSSMRRVVHTKA